ncbi:MAG: O-antigen ligase family protein [Candidatus Krumholzibacteriota bacterium]
MPARCATFFYGAALVTLPWSGAGVLKLVTGRDWGGGLQPSWALLAAAVLCATVDRLRCGDWRSCCPVSLRPALRRWWMFGTGAVLLSVLLSLAGLWAAPVGEPVGETVGRFGKQLVQLAIMAFFALWPAVWTRGTERWRWTMKLLLLGGSLQVLYGFFQGAHYFHSLPGFGWLDGIFTSNPSILSGSGELYLGDSFRHVPRLRGTICEPLYLGNYLLFLWPLTLVPVWSSQARRWLAGALLLLLLGTWSRGAWLGFMGQIALVLVMMFSLRGEVRRGLFGFESRQAKMFVGGLAALLVAVPLVGLAAGWDGVLFPFRRLIQTFSQQDWSNLTRLYSMQAAWRAFLLSPVVGIGWGQFGWHFPALVDPMGLQSQFTWPVVNNFPLLVLCETGLVGFLVFCGWVAGLVRGIRQRWIALPDPETNSGSDPRRKGRLVLAVAVCGAGVWLQLLTFSQYNLPHIWVSLGLMMALLADPELQADPPNPPGPGETES